MTGGMVETAGEKGTYNVRIRKRVRKRVRVRMGKRYKKRLYSRHPYPLPRSFYYTPGHFTPPKKKSLRYPLFIRGILPQLRELTI